MKAPSLNPLGDLMKTTLVTNMTLLTSFAKRGIIRKNEFPVISGAPILMKGQVSHQRVYSTLESAGVIKTEDRPNS